MRTIALSCAGEQGCEMWKWEPPAKKPVAAVLFRRRRLYYRETIFFLKRAVNNIELLIEQVGFISDSQLASNLRVICSIMLQYKLKCVTFLFFLSVATHRYAITLPGNKKIELIDYL